MERKFFFGFMMAFAVVFPCVCFAQLETHSITEDLEYALRLKEAAVEERALLERLQEARDVFSHFNSVYKGLNGANDMAKAAVKVTRAVMDADEYVSFLEQYGKYDSAREYLGKLKDFKSRTSYMLNQTKDACESVAALSDMSLSDKISKLGSLCSEASTYVDKELFMLKKAESEALEDAQAQVSKKSDDGLRSMSIDDVNNISRGRKGKVIK